MDLNPDDPQELTGRFRVDSDGSYTIKFQTVGGQLNPDPVVFDIHASKDAPPSIRFVTPGPRIKAPSNGKVALGIESTDDFGVKALNLSVVQGTEVLVSRDLLENQTPPRKFAGSEVIDLAPFNLKPGSRVEYGVVARDNHEPNPNSARTEMQVIEIGDPLPPAELARAEDKLREDNPPPPAEEQPRGEPDPARQVADRSHTPEDRHQGEKQPDQTLVRNDTPPPPDARPPAEPQTDRQPTPAELKKLDDLAKRLRNLEKAQAANDPPRANENSNPPPPPDGANPPPE